jgi:hypothetical protein
MRDHYNVVCWVELRMYDRHQERWMGTEDATFHSQDTERTVDKQSCIK